MSATPPPQEPLRTTEDGRVLGTRKTLATITGRPLGSLNVLAGTDPDFPDPVEHGRGRELLYLMDDLLKYAGILAARRAAPAAADELKDDEDDPLLGPAEAAPEFGIAVTSMPGYVRDSIPDWKEGRHGRLPIPDEETPRGTKLVDRKWRRSTARAWTLPGRGVGGGRPRNDTGRTA
jgi:hypothetical protein